MKLLVLLSVVATTLRGARSGPGVLHLTLDQTLVGRFELNRENLTFCHTVDLR